MNKLHIPEIEFETDAYKSTWNGHTNKNGLWNIQASDYWDEHIQTDLYVNQLIKASK